MKKLFTSFLILFFWTLSSSLYSQTSPDYIFGDDYGSGWNWTTGTQGTPSLGNSFKWQFQANANANLYFKFGETSSNADGSGFWYVGSGGDVQYPGGGNFGDKWTAIYHANMGDAGAFYFSVTSGNYYVIKAKKQSGSDADFAVFWNTAVPSSIVKVNKNVVNNSLVITITLNANKSSQEKVWIRYSKDNWTTSSTVQASDSLRPRVWSGQIPLSAGDQVSFYVFTTLNITSLPSESDADLYTINYDNNGGSNYSLNFLSSALSGNYYIPKGSNPQGFNTLEEAIANLNLLGANGTVKFLIDDNLNEIGSNLRIYRPDLNSTNNLLIKPNSGKTPIVTITGCDSLPSEIAYSGLTIDSTKYVTIDGSNTEGGTTRDLTFNMADGTLGRIVIQLYEDADFITIKNTKILFNQSPASSTSSRGIYANGLAGGASDSVIVENCQIGGGTYNPNYAVSITGYGTGGIYASKIYIRNNLLYGRLRTIYFFTVGQSGTYSEISRNIIRCNVAPPSGNVVWGILFNTYNGRIDIYKNILDTLVSASTGTEGVYGFGTLSGQTGVQINVYNNFLGGAFNHTGTGTPASIDVISIQDAVSGTANVYYNTVIFNNMTKTASGRMTCIRLGGTWTKNVKNNIFINKKTGTSIAYCILMGATTGTNNFDYNLYYLDDNVNGNVGYWSVARKTLADWQTASGQDANSVSKNVTFVSSTDLHLSASQHAGDYDLRATPITSITTDIDGDTRDNTYPYKGADELSVPAPVQLVSFTANYSSNAVKLNWSTATEVNNYGWEIERSKVDEKTNKPSVWEKIGFVKGSGNSNSPKEYTFVDEKVLYGYYVYRLKQIDNDGSYSYSNELRIMVGNKPQVYDVKNYPNPFNPQTVIRFDIPKASNVKLQVFDITGQLVATLVDEYMEAGVYERVFDGSRFASGIYISVLQAEDVKVVRKMQLIK